MQKLTTTTTKKHVHNFDTIITKVLIDIVAVSDIFVEAIISIFIHFEKGLLIIAASTDFVFI